MKTQSRWPWVSSDFMCLKFKRIGSRRNWWWDTTVLVKIRNISQALVYVVSGSGMNASYLADFFQNIWKTTQLFNYMHDHPSCVFISSWEDRLDFFGDRHENCLPCSFSCLGFICFHLHQLCFVRRLLLDFIASNRCRPLYWEQNNLTVHTTSQRKIIFACKSFAVKF